MIKHLVLFKLKDPACADTVRKLLLSMKGTVEQIREIEVGIDLYHTDRSFDIALSVLVENEKDLQGYAEHPYHAGVVKTYLSQVSEKSVIADYEV